jgi:hypothetical protein
MILLIIKTIILINALVWSIDLIKTLLYFAPIDRSWLRILTIACSGLWSLL